MEIEDRGSSLKLEDGAILAVLASACLRFQCLEGGSSREGAWSSETVDFLRIMERRASASAYIHQISSYGL